MARSTARKSTAQHANRRVHARKGSSHDQVTRAESNGNKVQEHQRKKKRYGSVAKRSTDGVEMFHVAAFAHRSPG